VKAIGRARRRSLYVVFTPFPKIRRHLDVVAVSITAKLDVMVSVHPMRFKKARCSTTESTPMSDVILIAVGCGLFLMAIAYANACDRL
jgi:hypothetical protein